MLLLLLLSLFSHVRLFETLWTIGHQAPLSLGFSRQELEWVATSFSRGNVPTQGWNPSLLHCRQILY